MDGRAVRWQQHNENRRLKLVAAAVELIEAGEPELSLQQVGEQAGLSRSVVYRHFDDRRDLFLAVQRHVLADLSGELEPALTLHGTVRETVEGISSAYVGWAVAHPRLHRLVDDDFAAEADSPLQQAIELIADQVGALVLSGFERAGAVVTDADRAASDPLVHGLVGMVFGTVRRWVQLGNKIPNAEQMTRLVSESILALIGARATGFGYQLDPDLPLETLLIGEPDEPLSSPRP